MTYNINMERAAGTIEAAKPSQSMSMAGKFAWTLSVLSILTALVSLGIAIYQASLSGNYASLITHQTLTPFITMGLTAVGALVASRRPRHPVGWIFVAVGVLYALIGLTTALTQVSRPDSPIYRWAYWLDTWLWLPATLIPATFVLLLFPDGRLPSPRWRPVAWTAGFGIALVVVGVMFHPGPLESLGEMEKNPFGIPAARPFLDLLLTLSTVLLLVGVAGSVAALVARFRRSAGIERKQMKWLVYAIGLYIATSILTSTVAWLWPGFQWGLELSIVVTNLGILGIAVAAAVAILRHRLYDIDLIIQRTLVYSALTVGVAALYGLLVGVLGLVFQARSSPAISLLATGLQAASYVRFVDSTHSDFQRTERQNLVLDALRDKLLTPSVVTKIPDLYKQFNDSIVTDLSPKQITDLTCVMQKLPKESITIKGIDSKLVTTGADGHMVAKLDEVKALLKELGFID